MKAYIVVITSGKYMFPIDSGKLYKSKTAAQKNCDKYNESHTDKATVLVADNWHKEAE
ncbi:hypothetical protein M4I17_02100 [Enterococcus thailandicus]|uniref:hypothetical protein n=1 Tax=Enterococcus thailandicus TaxID=417368 RepID=UPI002542E2BA|nr:hypothetical protein [Enterococcus thailandicus]MDK4351197.1 hypothetical protein [Enterococcus thailandicus]